MGRATTVQHPTGKMVWVTWVGNRGHIRGGDAWMMDMFLTQRLPWVLSMMSAPIY